MTSPVQVTRRWFEEMWNGRRADLIDELMGPTAVAHGLAAEPIAGTESFKAFYQAFLQGVPDLHIAVLQTVTEGDRVSIQIHATGTHTGDGLGPATNRPVDFKGIIITRVKDGRIAEAWNCIDFLTFYQQLGWVPNPVPPGATGPRATS